MNEAQMNNNLQKKIAQLESDLALRDQQIEALEKELDHYKVMIQNVDVGITRMDTNLDIVFANDTIGGWFDTPPREFVGKKCYDVFVQRDSPCPNCPGLSAIKSGKPCTIKTYGERDDGSQFTVLDKAFPFFDAEGNVVGFNEIIEDITDKENLEEQVKKSEEQLRQADKMASIGVLVSGVAHEINNPNTMIMLNTSFVEKVLKDTLPILEIVNSSTRDDLLLNNIPFPIVAENLPEVVGNIVEGSKRIKTIVRNLMDFARFDTGNLDEEIDLNSVVKQSVMIVDNLIKKSTHTFSTELSEEIPIIIGNEQQVEQVLINLITNACQALTSKNDAIVVRTKVENGRVIVEVEDSGEGVPEDILSKLKDPFFTTKRDNGGTGLGLSISHSIMDAHNGLLEYDSEVGIGTVARIIFQV